MLNPSLNIVCVKDLVPAKDKQEEPEEEEENATEVKVCTPEETTECTDANLDDVVKLNLTYPFCHEEEDLDAIVKNNLPVDLNDCSSTNIKNLINLLENNLIIDRRYIDI